MEKNIHQGVFEEIVQKEVKAAIARTGPNTDFKQWFREVNERLESLSSESVHIRRTIVQRPE